MGETTLRSLRPLSPTRSWSSASSRLVDRPLVDSVKTATLQLEEGASQKPIELLDKNYPNDSPTEGVDW